MCVEILARIFGVPIAYLFVLIEKRSGNPDLKIAFGKARCLKIAPGKTRFLKQIR